MLKIIKFFSVLFLMLILTKSALSIYDWKNSPRVCNNIFELNSFLASIKKIPTNMTFEKFHNIEDILLLEIESVSKNIYSSYRQGKWSTQKSELLDDCLQSWSDKQILDYSMQSTFKNLTLMEFENSGSSYLQNFAKKIRQQGTELTRIFGHFNNDTFTKAKAGFHRGQKSLFLDFSRIPANEWLIIFAHEYFHATDEKLMKAIKDFNNLETIETIIDLTKKYKKYQDLPKSEQQILNLWIMAGFHRGLLAEVRAWVGTVRVYQELRLTNKIQPVDWMERFFLRTQNNKTSKQQPFSNTAFLQWNEQKIAQEVIKFLSPRFTDPGQPDSSGKIPQDELLFTEPLIQDAMILIREEILAVSVQDKSHYPPSSIPEFKVN